MSEKNYTTKRRTKQKRELKVVLDHFEASIPGFKKIHLKRKMAFIELFYWISSERAEHRKWPGWSYLSNKWITERIGTRNFNRINNECELFIIPRGYSHRSSFTKRYRLTELVTKAKAELDEKAPEMSEIIMENGKIQKTLSSPLNKPILYKRWVNTSIQKRQYIDLGRLIHCKEQMESSLIFSRGMPGSKGLETHLRKAQSIIKHAHTIIAGKGWVNPTYTECDTGRLYGQGAGNIQQATKIIKEACFHDHWQYDFENCHYSIFNQLANRVGVHCNEIERYLAEKRTIRTRIAQDLSISTGEAKSALIAIIYGLRKTLHKESAIVKLIGRQKAKQLYQHPDFSAIHADVKRARIRIINKWPNQNRQSFINAVGLSISKDEENSKIMAHILQGLETRMLIVAIQWNPGKVVLLEHDGFITTSQIDIKRLNEAITIETELKMEMSEELLQYPVPFEDSDFQNEGTTTTKESRSDYLAEHLTS